MDMAPSELRWSDRIHIAAVLRHVCAEQKLTLLELAKKAGLNYSRVKAIARARAEIDAPTKRLLEEALGVRFRSFVVEFDSESSSRSLDFAKVRRASRPPSSDTP